MGKTADVTRLRKLAPTRKPRKPHDLIGNPKQYKWHPGREPDTLIVYAMLSFQMADMPEGLKGGFAVTPGRNPWHWMKVQQVKYSFL